MYLNCEAVTFITRGLNGPMVAGPFSDEWEALRVRDSMRRGWRMILRGERFWGHTIPADWCDEYLARSR